MASRAQSEEHAEVAGVRITHPERVVFPEQGLTKAEIAGYYETVAEHLLPHLRHRPLSLVRCPDGRDDHCFYQKHVGEGWPDAIGRVEIEESQGEVGTYAVAGDLAAVVGLVQMGVLELHVWGCRRDRLDRPDRLVLDLDPGDDVPWERVAGAARRVREILGDLGLESFVKTTGGKGLHVVIPVERRTPWDEARAFTRAVAERVVEEDPEHYVAQAAKEKRGGRVFLDYLRNARGATFVAPYSTRAKAAAPVSMPIAWDEVGEVEPDGFTVDTAPRRLATLDRDPWSGIGDVRQSITRAMRRELGLDG